MMTNKTFQQLALYLDLESEFYIASMDSSGTIAVQEGYRKAPNLDMDVQQMAEWTMVKGLQIPEREKYERRRNLTGVQLKICLVDKAT